jgi:hypothetical protein
MLLVSALLEGAMRLAKIELIPRSLLRTSVLLSLTCCYLM